MADEQQQDNTYSEIVEEATSRRSGRRGRRGRFDAAVPEAAWEAMGRRRRWQRLPWPCLFLLLLTSLLFVAYVVTMRHITDPLRLTGRSVDASRDVNVNFRREIASELQRLTIQIQAEVKDVNADILLRLNKLVARLDPRAALATGELLARPGAPLDTPPGAPTATRPEPDVCEDVFNGTRFGYPFYREGFIPSPSCDASAKPPLRDLVTVLILERDAAVLRTVLGRIRHFDPRMPVVFASTPELEFLADEFANVSGLSFAEEDFLRPGKTWNALTRRVRTPYTLLARDVFYFNDLSRLQRQIFAVSSASVVGVAGGAFRNESGYWKTGCYLSNMKNYFMKFTEGYEYSAMDCMMCDHLEGPFVARTSLLRDVAFRETLLEEVVFEDWFLRVKQRSVIAMSCPDAMYFTRGPVEGVTGEEKSRERLAWLGLAREWQVDRIEYPSRVSIHFGSEELGITCDARRWTSALLLPPCCVDQVRRAMKALDDFSKEKGVDYEIDTGTLLGAVKLRSFLPWDRDSDVVIMTKDYKVFYDNQDFFADRGFYLSDFKENKLFMINTPEITVEVWPLRTLSTFELPDEMWETPTRMKFLGMWVRGVWNPGLFARNRYGPDYLKHVQSWKILQLESSWETYKPGSWKKCPKSAHHSCLDQFPTDGSIGFSLE